MNGPMKLAGGSPFQREKISLMHDGRDGNVFDGQM
jgi:hypothetical protein